MHCEIKGEGAQAKALLIKKLKLDDVGIAKVISESIGIAENTAYSYLNRSRIPSASFHTFIEETFDCEYSDIIQSPDEQILGALERVSLNIEAYCTEAGLEKVEYLYRKSIGIKYVYGEVFGLSCLAILKLVLKRQDAYEIINEAVMKAKKMDFELLTYAITIKSMMLNYSGKYNETVKIIENHRKKINNQAVSNENLGKMYFQLGFSYRRLKEYSKAKRYMELAYNDSLTIKMKIRIRNIIGLILREQGKITESIRCFKKVFGVTTNRIEHAIVYNNMARSYMKLKNFDEAFICIERAINYVSARSLFKRRVYYFDTLFELIIVKGNNCYKFLLAYEKIECDLFYLENIYEYYNELSECIRKVVQIIIESKDFELMNRLIVTLKKASEFYDDLEIVEKLRLIFADTVMSFMNSAMIIGGGIIYD